MTKKPEGCICDPEFWSMPELWDWEDGVGLICSKFKGGITHHVFDATYCLNCEHHRDCHAATQERE